MLILRGMCEILRTHLEESGQTQKELAAEAGVDQRTIGRWVEGLVPRNEIVRMSKITNKAPELYLADVLNP